MLLIVRVVCVDCFLFLKYDLKYAVVSGVKLNSCCSLCMSFVCEIVSYAFDRSIYIYGESRVA